MISTIVFLLSNIFLWFLSLFNLIFHNVVYSEDQENKSLELFGGVAANKLEVVPENLELSDQGIQPSQSLEPVMKKKSGKYNLRESLAWNSAFLTDAGRFDAHKFTSNVIWLFTSWHSNS